MKNFIKNQKGFTLVELVVVIAIIGILAGIAVPRFLDATASARGAKIVADMRTIQSAEMIYYAKYAKYPTGSGDTNFTALVQGGWPVPPSGTFTIAQVLKTGGGATVGSGATAYTYANSDTTRETPGIVTLTGATFSAGGVSENPTLTDLLGGTTGE
ncbi:prepilin-type N-terminal cleavage/methylation domain-containing protein [Phascolarctobacterium faecium]|uniref:prepilin-type N-terminal cleavage/methylation domain-containing protein n=1 Tax=Phascolarctobacterium faecium TaxID=33025 RepID=UPI003AEF6379